MPQSREGAFFDYLKERYAIRLRKEAGEPWPWTEDSILREYKFTNVLRHHDKTSVKLREIFYDPNWHSDPRTILMNCALARYFGTWEFAKAAGWQKFLHFDFDGIKNLARQRLAERQRVFTGAYVITNQGIQAPKYEVVVDHFLRDLHRNADEICELAHHSQSWRKTARQMQKIPGFGGTGFMTKEILLDTTYTGFWKNHVNGMSFPNDWNDWTPIGPGALRGASRVLDEDYDPKTKPVNEARAFLVINDLWLAQEDHDLPIVLSFTDIQFGLCEFDKYERVRLGQGKPRSRYRP